MVETLWQVGNVGAESSVYPASLGLGVVCGFELMTSYETAAWLN